MAAILEVQIKHLANGGRDGGGRGLVEDTVQAVKCGSFTEKLGPVS